MLIMLVLTMTAGSCRRHGEAWRQMDAAESLMESHPDSALAILDSIPGSEVKGRETEARYALLMSMALDKNYIDTTDLKVLQPAIDYYPEHGTPD